MIPLFPFHVGDLKQSKIIFKRKPIELVEVQIRLHRIPEVSNGGKKSLQFGVIHIQILSNYLCVSI